MALSNIFREPRREITETVLGVVLVGVPLLIIDWWFSNTLFEWGNCQADPNYNHPPCAPYPIMLLFVTPVCLGVLAMVATIFAVSLHAAGEGICNALERRGVQARPRQRY